MHPPRGETMDGRSDTMAAPESVYESFRWLEDSDDLDLRLNLDDYHLNLREENTSPTKHWRPSFRRHLSVSKLPLGGHAAGVSNRPIIHESSPSLGSFGPPMASQVASTHGRSSSRAFSLRSSGRQPVPEALTLGDHAASHYQDPSTRLKLRTYLASPSKFDEAIEFGFPASDDLEENQARDQGKAPSIGHEPLQLCTFLDDGESSSHSGELSAPEPESPKTPATLEKLLPLRPARASQELGTRPKMKGAPVVASSREMTLRMTLTRLDLRAHEDQIYGWQKSPVGRKSQSREDSFSPVTYGREGYSKESIERQLAALDEEAYPNDHGVVRRFLNKVRRA